MPTEQPLEYELSVALERVIWYHCLRFTHGEDWKNKLEAFLKDELRSCTIALAKAKKKYPQLPICSAFSDVVDEFIQKL